MRMSRTFTVVGLWFLIERFPRNVFLSKRFTTGFIFSYKVPFVQGSNEKMYSPISGIVRGSSRCTEERSISNQGSVRLVKCGKHGGYYVTILGSPVGRHYEGISDAIFGFKSALRYCEENGKCRGRHTGY